MPSAHITFPGALPRPRLLALMAEAFPTLDVRFIVLFLLCGTCFIFLRSEISGGQNFPRRQVTVSEGHVNHVDGKLVLGA
ncbi:hypothetical protein J6590_096044 [Homalodisca vitripennis]|nr:hypothetical protein J6590_030357 [Homalodisca vitripennis]KAG8299631.1 hypothetical protein J6590_096044 [Homalodisca vitripennis]